MTPKKLFTLISLTFVLSLLFSFSAFAELATDITTKVEITCENITKARLTDDDISTHSAGKNVTITVESEDFLGGIYVIYNKVPTQGLLNDAINIAENGFMHEYIMLPDKSKSATLTYEDTDICDIYVYSKGELPEDVQVWQLGGNTDIMLCATHSDDDQLFFAGLLPHYKSMKNVSIQVVYFINHFDTYNRTHELLNGLWECGIRNYPEISPFPDGYSENERDAAQYLKSQGISADDVLNFQAAVLKKYKPQVLVLHDVEGEYGHGAHILNTLSMIQVCDTGLTSYVPKKIYIHLYPQNKIKMDFDIPLEAFSGRTAFQVSQDAFRYHKSQHWTWFYDWIYGENGAKITMASQIRTYNPCDYGLYFSSVGSDKTKTDMLENIETYYEKQEKENSKNSEFALYKKQLAEEVKEVDVEINVINARISLLKNNISVANTIFNICMLCLGAILLLIIIQKIVHYFRG